ncbi:hypothetical protein ACFE04_015070 [Oxalis oulophora]
MSSSSGPSEIETLRKEIVEIRESLVNEGTLDGRFEEIEDSNKQNYPLFVEETLTSYYCEAAGMVTRISQAMLTKPKEYAELDKALQQLRKSSSNVGAKKVRNAVSATRDAIRHEDIEEAKKAFEEVKIQLNSLMKKLDPYFGGHCTAQYISEGNTRKLFAGLISLYKKVQQFYH